MRQTLLAAIVLLAVGCTDATHPQTDQGREVESDDSGDRDQPSDPAPKASTHVNVVSGAARLSSEKHVLSLTVGGWTGLKKVDTPQGGYPCPESPPHGHEEEAKTVHRRVQG